MEFIQPARLHSGDHLRVIAPSRSLGFVGTQNSVAIQERFETLGLSLSYGRNVMQRDRYDSSPVRARIADFHEAFENPAVRGILTVIGGYNSIELLPHIDWDLVRENPKILSGYSDITTLQNAILAKTGLQTYSGPHWSTFGMKNHFDQTLQWFVAAAFNEEVRVHPASYWTDDLWFLDQENRSVQSGEGWWAIAPGEATGRAVGGNLSSFLLLQGTDFMPQVENPILFVEATSGTNAQRFAREMHSLCHSDLGVSAAGVVVGRFQRESAVSRQDLELIFRGLPLTANVPVMANVDFGHTNPLMTWPVGGRIQMSSVEVNPFLQILPEN